MNGSETLPFPSAGEGEGVNFEGFRIPGSASDWS